MSSAYSYNGMGLRVAESDSGSGEHDLINDGTGPGSSLLVDHTITAKTVAHVFTPGLEQRDGLNGALHLFGVDALGSVRALINDDSQQMVTDTLSFDAYGITRTRTATDGTPFGFAGAEGYQTDPNQLMLLGNREYHPFTGRFLTRDPAGAGDNDYEYADDNPLSYVDPSGLDFTDSNGNVWHDIGPSADPNVSRMVIGSGDDGESIIEAEGAGHPGNTLLRVGDSLLLNGAGSHYASVSSAYIRGDVGLGALVGASVVMVGMGIINLVPGGEEANGGIKAVEETVAVSKEAVTAAKEAGALKPVYYNTNKALVNAVSKAADVDKYAAGDMIHAIKEDLGLGGADNLGLDAEGGIWIKKIDQFTEQYVKDYLP